MKLSTAGFNPDTQEVEKRVLNSELWHACAGPLVSLPVVGSRVVYFPQGHSEQVAASTNPDVDAQIPNYTSLPPQLICQLHNMTMHADVETDEVYAQMTLQPLSPQEQNEPFVPVELGTPSKQPTNYFCKTLTASDTSTHGGFSVPRRAAENLFPPLDFSQQRPAQELIARDLHDNEWKFRHIFRGQPKRHLLTTGWSVFVSAKRLVAGDLVLFIWNDKNQLLLGIRRANRPQTVMPSSVLSSDSMHLGLLAAAAHAAATNSRFTIFYNPRASPSDFVIPLAKYVKAVYHTRVSVGMRFRMLFETEESSVRRYMGTITGISDLDPVKWPNSHWRSVKVGWDESTAGERQPRVSLWEIEPLTTFPMYPSPFALRLKRPWPPVLPTFNGMKEDDFGFNSSLMWLRADGDCGVSSMNFQGTGVSPWMQPRVDASMLGLQTDTYQAIASAALQEMRDVNPSKPSSGSILHFHQNILGPTASQMYSQILPQPPLPGSQESQLPSPQVQAQNQSHLYQLQLQRQNSINGQQQQQQLSQPPQLSDHQNIPNIVTSIAQFSVPSQSQSSPMHMVSSICQQQSFSDLNGKPVTGPVVSPLHSILASFPQDESSHLHNLPRSNPILTSSGWPSKRADVEPLLSSAVPQTVIPQVEQMTHQINIPQKSVSLPPFPGRGCSIEQNGSDPQNRLLFGVNIEPSPLLMSNGLSGFQGVQSYSTSIPFSSSNNISAGANFSPNPVTTPSTCVDELGFSHSPENVGQVKTPNTTFVKVYKAGSFGRSLDITKFSSYNELCSELARMFGLEGLLEDPLRSGWWLVFVNRENDVLLLGNDPWPEFVNRVWCIKILSPREVQQMGKQKQGLGLLNSVPNPAMTPSTCVDEPGFPHSPENVGQVSTPNTTFVKVYKAGSFGRSLDIITKFSSYSELRGELARMFGIEGLLERVVGGWVFCFMLLLVVVLFLFFLCLG